MGELLYKELAKLLQLIKLNHGIVLTSLLSVPELELERAILLKIIYMLLPRKKIRKY